MIAEPRSRGTDGRRCAARSCCGAKFHFVPRLIFNVFRLPSGQHSCFQSAADRCSLVIAAGLQQVVQIRIAIQFACNRALLRFLAAAGGSAWVCVLGGAGALWLLAVIP